MMSRIIAVNSGSAMLTPDYRTFLAAQSRRHFDSRGEDAERGPAYPVGAFLSIAARQKFAFLLESVEGGEKIGRYTFSVRNREP